ncbi:hypothetical protein, partial [Alteromonas macleodii]
MCTFSATLRRHVHMAESEIEGYIPVIAKSIAPIRILNKTGMFMYCRQTTAIPMVVVPEISEATSTRTIKPCNF